MNILPLISVSIVIFVKKCHAQMTVAEAERFSKCPKNWKYLPHGDACMVGRNYTSDTIYAHQARCKHLSKFAIMPEPRGKTQLTELCDFLKTDLENRENIYIGATDEEVEDVFKFISNDDLLSYYFTRRGGDWQPGQPNDPNPRYSYKRAQDCLTINKLCQFNDWECDKGNVMAICAIYKPNACQTNNGGCKHICIISEPRIHKCACQPGYELVNDTSCQDINECENSEEYPCQNGVCRNLKGTWQCNCNKYTKQTNEFGCEKADPCTFTNGNCTQICKVLNDTAMCDCMEGYEYDETNNQCWKSNKNGRSIFLLLILTAASLFLSMGSLFVVMFKFLKFDERDSTHSEHGEKSSEEQYPTYYEGGEEEEWQDEPNQDENYFDWDSQRQIQRTEDGVLESTSSDEEGIIQTKEIPE